MVKFKQTKLIHVANGIRIEILRMFQRSQSAHLGSGLSTVDILAALYFKVMKVFPREPRNARRDRFILSKGHGAAALYATLALRGFFPKKRLEHYFQNGAPFTGHVNAAGVPGVEMFTGSLGHGLAVGNGMALAAKQNKEKHRIFVLLSDGECDEGSTWEAILFAGHHQLDSLTAIVDYNKWQSFGRTKDVLDLEPFVDKWRSFKWETREVDGHNPDEIAKILAKTPFRKGRPSVLIAHTVKGYGLPAPFRDSMEIHYRPPSPAECAAAIKVLQAR